MRQTAYPFTRQSRSPPAPAKLDHRRVIPQAISGRASGAKTRVLTWLIRRNAGSPPVPDAYFHDEGPPQDARRAWRATRNRSHTRNWTHASAGPRARRFDLRHGPPYLRLGSLVRFAHQAAPHVWARILRR